MTARHMFIVFLLWAALFMPSEGRAVERTAAPEPEFTGSFAYVIGAGDVLDISVWRHPDLATEAVVRPDGKIAFPLIGDIAAGDMEPETLRQAIARRLTGVVRDPEVTVNVREFRSKKLFVLGEVYRPGVYPFEGRMSVLEALGKAGSYKEDTAALKSVIIIHRGNGRKPVAKRVNLLDVLQNARVEKDVQLEPGDIVFVPKTFIAKVDLFVEQFFTKTEPVLKYYLDIIDIDQRTPAGRSR